MPITKLIQAIRNSLPRDETDQGPSVERARVLEVTDRGEVICEFKGKVIVASQATDEPLTAGQSIWMSETAERPVVYGSVK